MPSSNRGQRLQTDDGGLTVRQQSPGVRVVAYGDDALLIDQLGVGDAAAFRSTLLQECARRGLAVGDVVPAAASLVVTCHATIRDELHRVVQAVLDEHVTPSRVAGDVVHIAVRYDGDDLAEVAAATSLTIADVIRLHSSADYQVEFCGFVPGFAYLRGLATELHLPRRSSPRVRVPAGAVAIASHYSAVYPRESPGGWHLLGTTSLTMWDALRTPPALLQPGARVRFVPES